MALRKRMKARYRMFIRDGIFYSFDRASGKRESLETSDRDEGQRILQAKNEGHLQPALNLQLAKTYLAASDPETKSRTWENVFAEIVKLKRGKTKLRWQRAVNDRALDAIRALTLLETRGEHFLRVLECGKVSTNAYLRRIHNFSLDMGWLLAPVVTKRQWPEIHYGEKRAITSDEHERIVERERNPEKRAYYEMCWHLGGAQGDVASLTAGDVDWGDRVISFTRKKSGTISLVRFGEKLEAVLRTLPANGPLFPTLSCRRESVRADFFRKRCESLRIEGLTLHSYRYAFAERARAAGMPERFAMEMLGHNSKAVHRAYAKKALVKVPSLEDYEARLA